MEIIANVERITGAREFSTTNRSGQQETIDVVGVMLETVNGAKLHVEVFGDKAKRIGEGGLQPDDKIQGEITFKTSEYSTDNGTRYRSDVRLLDWQVLNRNTKCF